jgi:hypothetical protein
MNSTSNGTLSLLHPSGENLYKVNPKLYLELERFRSEVRKTSILAGGDISNAVSIRVDNSPIFHKFPKLPLE